MSALESSPRPGLAIFTGGTSGAALAPIAQHLPEAQVSFIVSTADGGSATNTLREMYGGVAVGDLRKVLGSVSSNAAGELFHKRFTAGDALKHVKHVNERFLGAIAIQDETDAKLAQAVIKDVVSLAKDIKRYGGENGLECHTYGNLILTALRLQGGKDDLVGAAYTTNAWLQTRATVLPASTESHNLVVYDEAADVVVYGEGAADKYPISDSDRVHVWLERGETRNVMAYGREARRIFDARHDAVQPRAADEAVEAVRWSRWAVTGIGSPITSLYPALLPEGIGQAVRDQYVIGGEFIGVANPEAEATTPGLEAGTYLGWLERAVDRPFDQMYAGVTREDGHAAAFIVRSLAGSAVVSRVDF